MPPFDEPDPLLYKNTAQESDRIKAAAGGFEALVAYIEAHAADPGADGAKESYVIVLRGDKTAAPMGADGPRKLTKKVRLTLQGDGPEARTLTLKESGSLLYVSSGVEITLKDGVILRGRAGNGDALVRVEGGAFTLSGGEIRGNATSGAGGGVIVESGSFTMSGGKVAGNAAGISGGGGALVYGGAFTMTGGEITGNTAPSGGGVMADGGAFTLSGGKIAGNKADSLGGGGAYVYGGSFTMTGGEIAGNAARECGGGVLVYGGAFAKTGGVIYGSGAGANANTAVAAGKGHAAYAWTDRKYRDAGVQAGETLKAIEDPRGAWSYEGTWNR